jgi:hypothetical protein
MKTVTLKNTFCVIAPRCSTAWDRTWFSSEEETIEHAKKLLRKPGQKTDKLYVVQVVATVQPADNFEVLKVEKESPNPLPTADKAESFFSTRGIENAPST